MPREKERSLGRERRGRDNLIEVRILVSVAMRFCYFDKYSSERPNINSTCMLLLSMYTFIILTMLLSA